LGLERLLHPHIDIAQHASAKGKINIFKAIRRRPPCCRGANIADPVTNEPSIAVPLVHFPFSLFHFPRYSIPMPEHIEDIQHRYIDLKKRMELVRSYL
jgi:hypothetical protein